MRLIFADLKFVFIRSICVIRVLLFSSVPKINPLCFSVHSAFDVSKQTVIIYFLVNYCLRKIMRRILRKIAEGETSNLGDTTTLLDPAVVEEIKNGAL